MRITNRMTGATQQTGITNPTTNQPNHQQTHKHSNAKAMAGGQQGREQVWSDGSGGATTRGSDCHRTTPTAEARGKLLALNRTKTVNLNLHQDGPVGYPGPQ